MVAIISGLVAETQNLCNSFKIIIIIISSSHVSSNSASPLFLEGIRNREYF